MNKLDFIGDGVKEIRLDLREVKGDVKQLLIGQTAHEVRITALEGKRIRRLDKGEGKFPRLAEWFQFLLEAPQLWHMLLTAFIFLSILWARTNGWLTQQVSAELEKGNKPVAYVEHREHRVQEHD